MTESSIGEWGYLLRKYFLRTLGALITVTGVLTACAGALIFVIQVWDWLKTGQWAALSFAQEIVASFPDQQPANWLAHPESWVGLHAIVWYLLDTSIPLICAVLAAVLIVSGLAIFSASYELRQVHRFLARFH